MGQDSDRFCELVVKRTVRFSQVATARCEETVEAAASSDNHSTARLPGTARGVPYGSFRGRAVVRLVSVAKTLRPGRETWDRRRGALSVEDLLESVSQAGEAAGQVHCQPGPPVDFAHGRDGYVRAAAPLRNVGAASLCSGAAKVVSGLLVWPPALVAESHRESTA